MIILGRYTGQPSLITQPQLCHNCNKNQATKIQELNSFEPSREVKASYPLTLFIDIGMFCQNHDKFYSWSRLAFSVQVMLFIGLYNRAVWASCLYTIYWTAHIFAYILKYTTGFNFHFHGKKNLVAWLCIHVWNTLKLIVLFINFHHVFGNVNHITFNHWNQFSHTGTFCSQKLFQAKMI